MADRPAFLRLPGSALAAAAVLVGLTLLAIRSGLGLTGGRLVYPIDDPYIHMSIARNLALHGSWGVNPGRFEPASSSPLWIVLLALFDRLVGARDATPLMLNLVLGAAVVLVLDRWLSRFIARGPVRAFAVLAIAIAIPLPAVIATGMEATLHVLITMLLVRWATSRDPVAAPSERPWVAALLAALAMLTRFESVFLIVPLIVVTFVRGARRTAVALGIGAVAAVGGYMAFALPRGGLWLPNPVLVKSPFAGVGNVHGAWHFLTRIPDQLIGHRFSHMTALLLAAMWLLLLRPRRTDERAARSRLLLGVFTAAALLHVQLASLGWFFRYEAYLVTLGLVAVAGTIAAGPPYAADRLDVRPLPAPARALAAALLLVLAIPIATRSVRSLLEIAPAMRNIHEQQFQMARLVRDHFRDRVVAVNDLGAVGYYGGAVIEDLMGLAACDITREKIAGRFDREAIRRTCEARGVRVALVYRSWFRGAGELPSTWLPVARWTVPEEITVGDTAVTILATGADENARTEVRAAVEAFARELPPRVRVERLR